MGSPWYSTLMLIPFSWYSDETRSTSLVEVLMIISRKNVTEGIAPTETLSRMRGERVQKPIRAGRSPGSCSIDMRSIRCIAFQIRSTSFRRNRPSANLPLIRSTIRVRYFSSACWDIPMTLTSTTENLHLRFIYAAADRCVRKQTPVPPHKPGFQRTTPRQPCNRSIHMLFPCSG